MNLPWWQLASSPAEAQALGLRLSYGESPGETATLHGLLRGDFLAAWLVCKFRGVRRSD